MNRNLAEIAFILDRSGSMSSLQEQAISGFNRFLADQVAQPGDARLTLVLFDDEYLVPVEALAIRDVPLLDAATYVPRNTTALLDAIGLTVDRLGQRLAVMPEIERPAQVIVAILTDGLENASTRYTWKDIASRIRHQREKYNWQFLFLGANQDAIATASKMNIGAINAATFVANEAGIGASSRSLSRRTAALRASLKTGKASADQNKSLQQLLAEENAALSGVPRSTHGPTPALGPQLRSDKRSHALKSVEKPCFYRKNPSHTHASTEPLTSECGVEI